VNKPVAQKRKPGRPKTGRSSDPNYFRLTAYIPKTLHKRLKRFLVDRDLNNSELIEELLIKFLDEQEKTLS
jgi:hypothetical protein